MELKGIGLHERVNQLGIHRAIQVHRSHPGQGGRTE